MLDKKFKSDIRFGYVAQGGIALAGFLFMFVVTRYGSVTTYGALMLLVSASSVMGNLLSFRTNEALIAFYKPAETVGDLGCCKFAIVAGVVVDIVVGAILLGVVALIKDSIATALLKDSNAGGVVSLYGWVVFATMLKSSPFALLQAKERMKWVNALTLFENLLKLTIVLALVMLRDELTLSDVVIATLCSNFVALVVAYTPLLFEMAVPLRGIEISRNADLLGEYGRFCVNTFSSSALKAGNQNIDNVVLGYVAGPQLAGVYATFRQFLSPLAFLSGPLEAVAYPRFVKAVSQGNRDEMRRGIADVNNKLTKALLFALVIIAPVSLLYSFYNKLPLEISSYVAFFLMMATALFRSQLWWARPFSNSVNPTLSLKANLLATLFLVMALYPLIVFFGLIGLTVAMLGLSILLSIYWSRALSSYA